MPGWGQDRRVLPHPPGARGWEQRAGVGVAGPGVGRVRWGFSPLQAPHLLPLVLVVVHLRAVRQPLVPGLLQEWGDRVRPRQRGRAGRGERGRAGRGHAPRSWAWLGSWAPAGPRSRPSGSGERLAAACGEWRHPAHLRPAGSPPARPPARPQPGPMLTDTSREWPRQGWPRRPRSTPRSALQGGGAVRAAFRAGPGLPARPDLRRARLSPRPPRGSSGDMCTGPDDTVERREEVRGVGAPRVEGRPRLGPRPRSESPRVDAAKGRQVKRQDQAGVKGGEELDRGRGRGLTSLQEPLSPLRLGWGREPGVPRLLPG